MKKEKGRRKRGKRTKERKDGQEDLFDEEPEKGRRCKGWRIGRGAGMTVARTMDERCIVEF